MCPDKLTQCLRVSNGLEAILYHSRELAKALNNRQEILFLANWQERDVDTRMLDDFIEKLFDSIREKFKSLTGVDFVH